MPRNVLLEKGSAPPPPTEQLPCVMKLNTDGTAVCQILIEPEVLRRIRLRAQSQDLSEYVWQNIFKAALLGHVY